MTDQPIEPTDPSTIPDDTTVPPPAPEDAKQDDDVTESETV